MMPAASPWKKAAALGGGLAALLATPALAGGEGLSPDAILRAESTGRFEGMMLLNGQLKVRVRQAGDRQRHEVLGEHGRVVDVVVRDGSLRWHHRPDAHVVRVGPQSQESRDLARRIQLVRQNYRFQVLGQARVANRVVLITQFLPKHPGNLSHRLWVDLATRVPLVVERRAPDGKLVDRAEFTQIAYAPQFAPATFSFQVPQGCQVKHPETLLGQGGPGQGVPSAVPFRPAPPKRLPPGYALTGWQYYLGPNQVPTFAWRFHDGLNLLSVYAVDSRHRPPAGPASRELSDAQNTRVESRGESRMVSWEHQGIAYMLMGDLPEATLLAVRGTP